MTLEILKGKMRACYDIIGRNHFAPRALEDKKMNQPTIQPFKLENQQGNWIEVIPFGGIISKIMLADYQGNLANCVLGFQELERYQENPFYFGASVGRCANRIDHGHFTVNAKQYSLELNEGPHHLHGGPRGFSHLPWKVEDYQQDAHEASLTLSIHSQDGDQGYPGDVFVTQKIRFDSENKLHIEFEGKSSQATPLNLTNHSYFNLSGKPKSSVLDHSLLIPSNRYLAVNKEKIPVSIETVTDSPFDFTTLRSIASNFSIPSDQKELAQGIDHSYLLDESKPLSFAAELVHEKSGRKMQVYTTKPAVQIYSGNDLPSIGLTQYAGICFETQYPPDYPNSKEFSKYILQADELYQHRSIFAFSTFAPSI